MLSSENVLKLEWTGPERFLTVLVSLDRVQGIGEFRDLAKERSFDEVGASWLT